MSLILGAGMGQAYGQAANLDSRLTSTLTSQVLLLNTNVFPLGNGLYRWQFTLQNPFTNTARVRFFTAAPNCDLSQISNIQSPAGWVFQVFRQGQSPDAPKINWMVGIGQPGPFAPGTPWLNPTPGQNSKVFSFDLPFGANNQSGKASALNTFGFSGATLGCQIGNLNIISACPVPTNPDPFRVTFQVQFQNRGDVTITITRGGLSLSQTKSNIGSGTYSVDFNLGAMPTSDEIVQTTAVATENGVSFSASATTKISPPIVILPGLRPTDPQDSALDSGSPLGLVNVLTTGFPSTNFVCAPLIRVAPYCLPGDTLSQAADRLEQYLNGVKSESGVARVHLVGHGCGAIVARYYLAQRDRTAASVRSLALVSPPNRGTLRAILSPNRNDYMPLWPAYPFWEDSIGGSVYITPQNFTLSDELGFFAPPVPTLVLYGTGTDTPAIAVGSSTSPYDIVYESGDGTVIERSATALTGASFQPIPGLKFNGGLGDPTVGQAILSFIRTH